MANHYAVGASVKIANDVCLRDVVYLREEVYLRGGITRLRDKYLDEGT